MIIRKIPKSKDYYTPMEVLVNSKTRYNHGANAAVPDRLVPLGKTALDISNEEPGHFTPKDFKQEIRGRLNMLRSNSHKSWLSESEVET